MKIVFFTQNIKKGGLDTFILNIIENWPEPDDEITLFCNHSHPGFPNLENQLAAKVRVISYDFWISQDIQERLAQTPSIFKYLIRMVFWLFGFPYLIFQTGRLLKKAKCDHLMVINGGYPGGDACLAASIAWGLIGSKHKAWHNFHNITLPYPQAGLKRMKEKLIDRFVAKSSAGFISVSQSCLSSLAEQRPIFADTHQRVIYNGINNLERSQGGGLREELNIPLHSHIVLMLGVYEPRKGHTFAIKTMEKVLQQCPETWLLACGDGNLNEIRSVQLTRDSSSAREHILLQNHRKDLVNLLSNADLLIMPSQSQESFGYAVVEAMGCGLPVVVSDIGGLPEVVLQGTTGYIVQHDNINHFAECVSLLLQNGTIRKTMGNAGKKRVEKLFNASRMADNYRKILLSLPA